MSVPIVELVDILFRIGERLVRLDAERGEMVRLDRVATADEMRRLRRARDHMRRKKVAR